MARIILGVTGSATAREAIPLTEKLTQNGYLVDVVLTGALPHARKRLPARHTPLRRRDQADKVSNRVASISSLIAPTCVRTIRPSASIATVCGTAYSW